MKVSPISAASPDMPTQEFQRLVEDIKAHGQLVPIRKEGDEVIDGRKRLRACELLGIEPICIDLSPGQSREALAYSLNILRTHYDDGQRAQFLAEWHTSRPTGVRKERKSSRSLAHRDLGMTVQEAAKIAGVGTSTVYAAKQVRRDGAPEVIEAVKAGDLTLYSARAIVAKVPKHEQAAVVAEVVKTGTGTSHGRLRPTNVLEQLGLVQAKERRIPRRPLEDRMEVTINAIVNFVDILLEHVAELGDEQHPQRSLWVKRLRQARAKLARGIHDLQGRGKRR